MDEDWQGYADRLAARALADGTPAAWFDRLYAAAEAGDVAMPWDRTAPNQLLIEWARREGLTGDGRRALVTGCGLGADAEYVASLGFATTGIDVSGTAIGLAQRRNPDSPVDYRVADLLHPPAELTSGFDLVVEIYTVQALPVTVRADAIASVAGTVALGGTLLVIAFAADRPHRLADGPPWPLVRSEVDAFAASAGLAPVRIERTEDRWRATFHRPGA
jgi:hypothetical protein